DDTTTGVGWTGIDGDQLLLVLHPQPGKDVPAKVPLMDVTELVLKKSNSSSPSAGSFTLTRPPSTSSSTPPSSSPIAPTPFTISTSPQTSPPLSASPSSQGPTPPSTQPSRAELICGVMLADNDRLTGAVASWSDKRIVFHPNIDAGNTIKIPVANLH